VIQTSIVVPVYRNAENIPGLLVRLAQLHQAIPGGIEAVCVIDGSPDASGTLLETGLAQAAYPSQLIWLSRNFGSFAAIREGLRSAKGQWCAVMAADLQEPASFIEESIAALRTGEVDVVIGTRAVRNDPLGSRLAAGLFWSAYRRFIQPDIPKGGVDVFACNGEFRDHLVAFAETHSSLVGQLMWLGFRRLTLPYERLAREHGSSAWGFRRKVRYLLDSVFSFSDWPIRMFVLTGAAGLIAALALGITILLARVTDVIAVPGYAATMVAILFFAGINLLGLGVIGSYVWRTYENTKARPLAVVMRARGFKGNTGKIEP
jgi:glycosyltransferase involved in cell wall biosynthesis